MADSFSVMLLSGLSGAGKTSVINVLEDLNFFTIDGLPIDLTPHMLPLLTAEALAHYHGLAIGLDLRQKDLVRNYLMPVLNLRSDNHAIRMVFVEAELEVIMRRYATTRRPHPLEAENLGLEQAILVEKERFKPMRDSADTIIDTSGFTIHDLRRFIQKRCVDMFEKRRNFHVHLVSFGFKYGFPAEADLMFDLRFLPNPFFVEELRRLNGKDKAVADHVLAQGDSQLFLARLSAFLEYLLPLYENEGRYRVTIALGCTGGRHRSVAVTEAIADELKKYYYAVSTEHRHLELG
ncbi:MAG: RNase adapter RapZ [Deltaproteobacteria bacterium]|jgi:UPF0042 nucleotide-binding protein|nr:RNase adapter RapZ [Deltaproteobacteria bacterium]